MSTLDASPGTEEKKRLKMKQGRNSNHEEIQHALRRKQGAVASPQNKKKRGDTHKALTRGCRSKTDEFDNRTCDEICEHGQSLSW